MERQDFIDVASGIASLDNVEEQAQAVNALVAERDRLNSALCDGVPDGCTDWHDAYNSLHKKYVSRFVSGSPEPDPEPAPKPNQGPQKFADLFQPVK